MIKCKRCEDNTTLDYIAFGGYDNAVCLDCITADEQDQLDARYLGLNTNYNVMKPHLKRREV